MAKKARDRMITCAMVLSSAQATLSCGGGAEPNADARHEARATAPADAPTSLATDTAAQPAKSPGFGDDDVTRNSVSSPYEIALWNGATEVSDPIGLRADKSSGYPTLVVGLKPLGAHRPAPIPTAGAKCPSTARCEYLMPDFSGRSASSHVITLSDPKLAMLAATSKGIEVVSASKGFSTHVSVSITFSAPDRPNVVRLIRYFAVQ